MKGSADQSEAVNLSLAFCAGVHEVDAGRFKAGVAEDVCEARDVFALFVVGACEDMAHVVRKYLARGDSSPAAYPLHFFPYLFA